MCRSDSRCDSNDVKNTLSVFNKNLPDIHIQKPAGLLAAVKSDNDGFALIIESWINNHESLKNNSSSSTLTF